MFLNNKGLRCNNKNYQLFFQSLYNKAQTIALEVIINLEFNEFSKK